MRITIIDNETKTLKKLINIFHDDELNVFAYEDKYDLSNSDLVILTWWSHYSIFHRNNPYKKEIDLIRKCNKPIVWICLWSQLIAKAFWSSFWELSSKIRKIIKIKYVDSDKECSVYECHRYYIDKLWSQLLWLAKSKYWWEIIKHKRKNIFGMQFHPEITKWDNDWLSILKGIIEDIKANI